MGVKRVDIGPAIRTCVGQSPETTVYGYETEENGEMRLQLPAETWQVGRAAGIVLGFEGKPLPIKLKAHGETVVEFTVVRKER